MKHVHFKWKSPIRSGKKWNKTHPQPPIPSNRHPSYIGTDIHRPVIINVKRFLRMFAERLTSAAIFFLHPTPDTLASSLRADTFHALCQNAGFAGYWFIASAAYRPCLLHPSNFCLPPDIAATAAQRKLKIGAEAHQNIAARADQKKNCCRVSPEYCCEKLPRENRHRISPKYCCQSLPEKWLPNLTKNVATRAFQRTLLPKLTKILLPKPSKESAAKSQQNIAAKENWKLVPKLTRILLPELTRKKLLSSLTRILLWKAAQRE